MSDSNRPGNKKFPRLQRHLERAKPAWRGVVIVAKAFDEGKKVIALLLFIMGGGTLALWNLAPTDPPAAPAQKEAATPQEAEPKSLTPLIPEKTKPECLAVTLAKMRQVMSETDADSFVRRNYLKRSHCGWHLNVAGEPYRQGNLWRVRFVTRDGVRVIAEFDRVLAVGEGDIVQVGGVLAAAEIHNGVPTVLLQRAWIQRR